MKMTYNCDYCPAIFSNKQECEEHEKLHPDKESLRVTSTINLHPILTPREDGYLPDIVVIEDRLGNYNMYEKRKGKV